MHVGYYRSPADNPKTRRINAMCYQYYGMELVCFGPNDVDIDAKMINGKVLINGKWVTKKVNIPKIINNSPFKQKNTLKIYDFLDENSYLMFTKYKNKETINKLLLEDGHYESLLIPTKGLNKYEDIINFIDKFNSIILKPKSGSQGRGIYSLMRENEKYILVYGNKKEFLNEDSLKKFIEGNLLNKNYIIQKEINSKNSLGQPFDIRIQFEKDRNGQWCCAQSYVRVGNKQKVVSNISKGGSVIRLIAFLKSNYGDDWEKYNENILKLTKGLPEKIEMLNKANITSLAFDFGLEGNKMYLYEVNYFPGGTFARGEIAMLRAAYTKYLLREKLNVKIKTSQELVLDCEKMEIKLKMIENERDNYKKKLYKVKNSSSWKVTKPIRVLGRIIKNFSL